MKNHKYKKKKLSQSRKRFKQESLEKKTISEFESEKELIDYLTLHDKTESCIIISSCVINFDFNFTHFLEELSIISKNDDVQMVVEKDIVIENVKFNSLVCFSNLVLKGEFRVLTTTFSSLVIAHCDFVQHEVSYFESKSSIFWSDCKLLKNANLIDCTFQSDFYVHSFELEKNVECVFDNCSFLGKVSFAKLNLSLHSEIFFEDTKIYGQFNMSDCQNVGKISFVGEIAETARLEINRMNYIIGRDGDLAEFLMGYLGILSSNVDGTLSMYHVNLNKLDLEGSRIKATSFTTTYLFYTNLCNKETALILKQSAITSNDSFLISKYKAEEFNCQLRDGVINSFEKIKRRIDNKPLAKLERNQNKAHWIRKQVRAFFSFIVYLGAAFTSKENFLLFLNKYSNEFGLSWLRGLKFTLIITFIFYWLINYFGMEEPIFVVDWRFSNFEYVFKGYINLLNIISFNKEIFQFRLTAIGELIFLMSRVFIAYGIYQTISAFRKYGK